MPDFHRLDAQQDAVFLKTGAADPLSRVAFRPGNVVARGARSGQVVLRETWDALGGATPAGDREMAPWDARAAARAASGDGAATARPPRLAPAPPPTPAGPERRPTALWVALGVAALAVAGLVAWAALRGGDEPTPPPPDAPAAARLEATAVEPGETEGALAEGDFRTPDGRYQDLYTFAADSSGRVLTVSIESNAFAPDLVVETPAGETVEAAAVEETDDGRQRVTVRDLRGPGLYRLLVSSRRPQATGPYAMTVRFEEPLRTLPTSGTAVTGELTALSPRADGFYRDTYSFAAAAGREHTITVRSSAFAPALTVLGPGGRPVEGGAGGRAGGSVTYTFTPAAGGAYRAVVSTREAGRTGAYSVQLALGPAPAATPSEAADPLAGASGALRAGAAPVRDSLADGESKIYSVSGRIGDRVTVDLRADGFAPSLYVVGPDGQQTPAEVDGDRARVRLTLPSDGRFRVVAGSAAGAGAFTLSLEQRAAITAAPIPRLPGADLPRQTVPPPPPVAPPGTPPETGGTYRPQPLGDGR